MNLLIVEDNKQMYRAMKSFVLDLAKEIYECGSGSEALAAYARCKAVLAAEFGTAPSPETRALARSLRAGGEAADPRLRDERCRLAGRLQCPCALVGIFR